MQRRKFMQHSLLAGSALLGSAAVLGNNRKENKPADEKPFHLNYGFHDGMFKNSAGADFTEQIKFGYDHGFRSIEDNGISGRTLQTSRKLVTRWQSLVWQWGFLY